MPTAITPQRGPSDVERVTRGRPKSLVVRSLLVVTLAIGGGWCIWRLFFYVSPIDAGMGALRMALRRQRPVEARVTGLDYAPFPVTRGGKRENTDYAARDRAELLIQNAAAQRSDAKAHHALGRLYLAKQEFEKAIDQIDRASKLDGKNAGIESDYGAALMELGRTDPQRDESGKGFHAFARALEHLNKAISLDGSALEPLFNRGLCREYLRLYNLATEDWKSYLEKDANSDWGQEARNRLKTLEDRPRLSPLNRDELLRDFLDACKARDDDRIWRITCQSRDSSGSFVVNRLVADYLDLANRRLETAAQERLDALTYAGDVARRRAKDEFVADLARFLDTATPLQRKKVSLASKAIRNGRDSISSYAFDKAVEYYKVARAAFEEAGDECDAMSMAYPIANCYVQISQPKLALALYEPLSRRCEEARYTGLLAQTLFLKANAELHLRDFSAAMVDTQRSMKVSAEMDDMVGVANALYQLAEEYRYLNNPLKALDLHVRDVSLAYAYLPNPTDLWSNYFSLAQTFDRLDLSAAAIDFQTEALDLALEAGGLRLICRSYNYMGAMLAKHGKYDEAVSNIEHALEIGNSFTEMQVRLEAQSYSFLQLGYVFRESADFGKAIENYDHAIHGYDELDQKFYGYTARKAKLLCCIQRGGCESTQEEMDALLTLFEQHRSKILEQTSRDTFFDGEQNVYDVAIAFEYDTKNDVESAFEYSERSRGRSLADSIEASVKIINRTSNPDLKFRRSAEPMSLAEIRSRMPPQSQILQYAVLKNSVLVWLISTDSAVFSSTVSIPIDELTKKVNSFLRHISDETETDSESFSRDASGLYDVLIKPVEPHLDPVKQICIVPDKALNYLPFAALRSRTSGRYFVEDHTSMYSPSSSVFVTCSEEAARKKQVMREEKLVSIGDPQVDHETFPDLDSLPSAAREAEAIGEDYGSSSLVLTGPSATKRRVIAEMLRSDVIHVATHAVPDPLYPLRSKLIFAQEPSESTSEGAASTLQSYEIYDLKLVRPKLVVLSACGTGVETYKEGEGMVGLSRPFTAKGVPLVIGSLWPVNTDSAADLMINFHHYRRRYQLTTAEALRRAQMDMIHDAKSGYHLAYHWAPFVTIGGYAEF